MRIGELAKAAGVSPRSLRYYEQRGLLRARRRDNGYREYDASAVTRVHNIRTLLDTGLKADEIRALGSCLDDHDPGDHDPGVQGPGGQGPADARALYEQRLRVVRDRLAALAEVERRIADKLGQLPASPGGGPRQLR